MSLPRGPLAIGESAAATVTLRDASGGELTGRRVTWTSGDPAVARVSSSGAVTGVGAGRAVITATAEDRFARDTADVVFAVARADFAAARPETRSMSGFLLGTRDGTPPAELLAPLRPQLWRDRFAANYERVTGLGARYMLLLSDHWGHAIDGWPRGRPYEETAAYEAFVREMAGQWRGKAMIWDVWNEPDTFFGLNFWDGTEEEFFATYLRAYRVLREELGPEAVIAGPSISRYDEGFLRRFADFCLANGCEINVLTWHEMGHHRPLSTIAEHLRTMRRQIVQNPRYAALRIREIHINEIVGPPETLNPAASLSYFRYLEEGGADAAARACWPGTDGVSTCENNTLDGLLTRERFEPRAVWWLYKAYTEGVEDRVESASTDPRLAVLASRSVESGVAQLLLGYSSVYVEAAPRQTRLGVHLSSLGALLASPERAHVIVEKIPAAGEAAVPGLLPVFARDVEVGEGEDAHFVIEEAEQDAVYLVRVSPAT